MFTVLYNFMWTTLMVYRFLNNNRSVNSMSIRTWELPFLLDEPVNVFMPLCLCVKPQENMRIHVLSSHGVTVISFDFIWWSRGAHACCHGNCVSKTLMSSSICIIHSFCAVTVKCCSVHLRDMTMYIRYHVGFWDVVNTGYFNSHGHVYRRSCEEKKKALQ